MAAGDTPAEPADAGSSTPRTEPPIFPDDYDLTNQPNQAASEPPEPPAPEGLMVQPMTAGQRAAEKSVMRARAEVGDELKEDKVARTEARTARQAAQKAQQEAKRATKAAPRREED